MGNALRAPTQTIPLLHEKDLKRLALIADREAGISLGPDRTDFLVARLSGRLAANGMSDFEPYCDLLERPDGQAEVRVFLESITIHTTSFFRERGHYDWLRSTGFKMLWEQGAGHTRDLVIWSAACSIGAELYTAMITCMAARDDNLPGLRFQGIGTDLSRQVVRIAENAVYSAEEIMGIPNELRPACLLSSKASDGRYRIVPELRKRTTWRTGNLSHGGTLGPIQADVVMLRNVLIYFDEATQARVISNVLERMRPGGFLLTGHSETATARDQSLKVIRPTIYQKVE